MSMEFGVRYSAHHISSCTVSPIIEQSEPPIPVGIVKDVLIAVIWKLHFSLST